MSIWFTKHEILPDQNRFNELISLIVSHGLVVVSSVGCRVTLVCNKFHISLEHDKYYNVLTSIEIFHVHNSKYNTYTSIKGFSMENHENVTSVLNACNDISTDLDTSIAKALALIE